MGCDSEIVNGAGWQQQKSTWPKKSCGGHWGTWFQPEFMETLRRIKKVAGD